ncbi:MAG: carboxypeptidase regulatory-like domain-containing protein [Myxococcota bacterium]
MAEDPHSAPERSTSRGRRPEAGWRGAAAGLLVVVCFLIPGTDGLAPPPAGPATAADASGAGGRVGGAPSQGASRRDDADPPSPLSGRVYGPDGRPVAGAEVTVAGSGIWPPRRLATEDDGTFRAEELPAGVYEVRARKGGLVAEPRLGLTLSEGVPVFVSLRLSAGVALAGRVVDARSGDPIEGARVTVSEDLLSLDPRTAETDAEGRFRVTGLMARVHRVTATADGYVARVAEERTPGDAPVRLALDRAATIAGVVVDHLDHPVAGARIELVGRDLAGRQIAMTGPAHGLRHRLAEEASEAPAGSLPVTPGPVPPIPASTTLLAPAGELGGSLAPEPSALEVAFVTGSDGRFAIEGVPPGHLQIIARHPDHAPGVTRPRRLVPGGSIEELEVVLPEGGAIEGRVLDERGQPVPRVPVQMRMEGEPGPRLAVSGEDGTFRFAGARGTVVLAALPEGQPVGRLRTEVGGGQRREVELRLPGRSETLRGRTVDDRGFPVADVQVTVEALRPDAPVERTTRSADDGTFEVARLPGPPYRLTTRHFDHAPTRLDRIDAETATGEVQVTLRPGTEVRGRVLDGFDDVALGGAEVALRAGDRTVHETLTNNAGEFYFRRVPQGNYEVFMKHDDFAEASRTVALKRSPRGLEPVDVGDVELEPGGTVSGQVTDRHGDPVGGAEVAVGSPPRWSEAVRADAEGHFTVPGVQPGAVHVEARHPAAGRAAAPHTVVARLKHTTRDVVIRLPRAFDPDSAGGAAAMETGVAVDLAERRGRVRVARVHPESAAARAGLKRGDVLEAIDEVAVESASQAADLLRGPEGVRAFLDVRRADEVERVLIPRERYLP